MKYSFKWTQPTQEQTIEAILAVSPMLEALSIINRIKQL